MKQIWKNNLNSNFIRIRVLYGNYCTSDICRVQLIILLIVRIFLVTINGAINRWTGTPAYILFRTGLGTVQ